MDVHRSAIGIIHAAAVVAVRAVVAEMLDLIFDNIYFEPAMIYHNTMLFDLIATDAPQAKANRFASMIEKKSNAAQKSLDKVVSALTELEH